MRRIKISAIILFLFAANILPQEIGKDKNFDYTSYGQMIYWKALSISEKKVFLYSYLYRTYEILNQINENQKLKPFSDEYEKIIAEPVFDVFRNLDDKKKEDLIYWINIFYRNDVNRGKPFCDAIYFRKSKLRQTITV